MTGKTHLLGGAAAATVVVACTLPPAAGAGMILGGSLFGSLFPDIDKRGTKISNRMPILNFLVTLFFSHRGMLHDATFYAAVAALTLSSWYASGVRAVVIGFLAGVFSHLLLDALNSSGVPIFLLDALRAIPARAFKRKRYRLARLKTGGLAEILVCGCLLAVILGTLSVAKFPTMWV